MRLAVRAARQRANPRFRRWITMAKAASLTDGQRVEERAFDLWMRN